MTLATTPSPFPRLSYALALSSPEAFIPLLRSALLTTGFFYLVDIPSAIPDWEHSWDALFASCDEFFELPQEEKDRIAMKESRHFRGYSAVGVEVTAGKRDVREQIDLGPETAPFVPYPPSPTDPIELSLYGPNLYPSLPSFEPSLAAYRAHCSSIAQHLLTLFADSLTPHPELLTSLFRSPTPETTPDYSRMKVVRYPAVEEGASGGSLGVGAHKDGGGLTLLAQDSVGGLEVQRWDGVWVPVEPIPYALVINVGQVLERLSASLYPATTHRVVPPPLPRLSIPFFFSPVLTATLTPLPLSALHPELRRLAKKVEERKEVSEVPRGDLHEEVFGRAAWRGITRSHGEVWKRWYGEWDTLGGPETR